MGGNIAWTLRLQDGTEYRMERWTNIFPEATDQDDFLSGDPAAIEESLAQWKQMKADWEENKETGNYRHNMTSAYAPYPALLAPSEYGFIVTDFISKTIVACNHYTSIGRERAYNYYFLSDEELEMERGQDEVKWKNRLKFLVEAGRITTYYDHRNPAAVHGHVPYTGPLDFKTFLETVLPLRKENALPKITALDTTDESGEQLFRLEERPEDDYHHREGVNFLMTSPPKGWTYVNLRNNTKEERQRGYDKVLELGFDLSEEEQKGFKDWIEETGMWSREEDVTV